MLIIPNFYFMKHNKTFQDVTLLALRLVIAAIFIYAGYAKFGMWSAAPAGMSAGMVLLMKFLSIVEPLGGVALIAGFLTCWASAGFAVIMVGAIGLMQFTMGVGFSTAQGPGWDFPLMILAGCLALMAFGAGRWSVDAKMNRA
ncbi:DoxX family protein [Candidatus Peregrinibacteria bacterium]|nr:DoxX family protein [Candidatus Peregrinibacteria bacterium]